MAEASRVRTPQVVSKMGANLIRVMLLFVAFFCTTYLTAVAAAPYDKKLDSLVVYGDGFMFSAKEPQGWKGDTKNANKYGANIIFYPASQRFESATTVIRILVTAKTDENIKEDLAADMSQYRKQYAGIRFADLTIIHPTYVTFPKLFTVPGDFYEYVTYINPGPKSKLMFSVSMNKQKVEASADDLAKYQEIISSLLMML